MGCGHICMSAEAREGCQVPCSFTLRRVTHWTWSLLFSTRMVGWQAPAVLRPPPNPSTRAVHGCLAFTWCSCFQLSHFLALESTVKETHFTAQALNLQSSCLTQVFMYLESQVRDTRPSFWMQRGSDILIPEKYFLIVKKRQGYL